MQLFSLLLILYMFFPIFLFFNISFNPIFNISLSLVFKFLISVHTRFLVQSDNRYLFRDLRLFIDIDWISIWIYFAIACTKMAQFFFSFFLNSFWYWLLFISFQFFTLVIWERILKDTSFFLFWEGFLKNLKFDRFKFTFASWKTPRTQVIISNS